MEKEMKTKSNTSAYTIRSVAWAGFLSFGFIAAGVAVNSPNGWHKSAQATAVYNRATNIPVQPRVLTFAERVAYQRAIEEVYWRHRIWPKERPDPKPSFDAVMTQAQLEKKVEDYLRKSQTLKDYWQQPLTASQLQAETDRMARHTKQPKVLRELFEALGNDPFVIAECLARPVLAERLLTHSADEQVKQTSGTYEQVVAATSDYSLPSISDDGECTDDTWTRISTTNVPTGRAGHTAVWTGSEMIVWGGVGCSYGNCHLNTGGRYNPSTDSWTATSITNAPTARDFHTAVWTGSEMIVWGGGDDNFILLNSGGRYSPSTDTWTATTTNNAPTARSRHTAVWTGSEMIVWGGYDGTNNLSSGGRYNPSSNSWIATSTTNAPSGRDFQTAVWTGSEMIVWGGVECPSYPCYVNTGGRYNPSADTWTATSSINAPEARSFHTAVWTGGEMIVWGGLVYHRRPTAVNTGGRYNPSTDSWTATSTTNAPDPRVNHTAVWTGSQMIVWGGSDNTNLNTGGRYNPNTDSWTATSTTNAPVARASHTAVWTGSEMIIWGGYPGFKDTGKRYCANVSQLGNISTRAFVQTGDNVVIGGFMVQGTQTKRVIIRAIGPELTQYGVPNALANPTLELHNSTGALIASNDNWQHTIIGGIIIADQRGDIRNSGYAPGDGRESAIIAELPAGNYTAIMRGVNNMTGVALVEIYDLSTNSNSVLANISTRALVQTSDDVMIGGFIVAGGVSKKVIVRAIGPELTQYGVPNALANPTLELHNSTGALIASNDNWVRTIIGGIITANQFREILDSGYAPTDLAESAIIAELPPGNYTAIVRGVNSTTGVGLVEVYDLDQ
jgi:N-acetylneuraminic acid mutarotase